MSSVGFKVLLVKCENSVLKPAALRDGGPFILFFKQSGMDLFASSDVIKMCLKLFACKMTAREGVTLLLPQIWFPSFCPHNMFIMWLWGISCADT